jgi:hypothetical protein
MSKDIPTAYPSGLRVGRVRVAALALSPVPSIRNRPVDTSMMDHVSYWNYFPPLPTTCLLARALSCTFKRPKPLEPLTHGLLAKVDVAGSNPVSRSIADRSRAAGVAVTSTCSR